MELLWVHLGVPASPVPWYGCLGSPVEPEGPWEAWSLESGGLSACPQWQQHVHNALLCPQQLRSSAGKWNLRRLTVHSRSPQLNTNFICSVCDSFLPRKCLISPTRARSLWECSTPWSTPAPQRSCSASSPSSSLTSYITGTCSALHLLRTLLLLLIRYLSNSSIHISRKCWHTLLNTCFHIAMTTAIYAGGISLTSYPLVCQAVSFNFGNKCEHLRILDSWASCVMYSDTW